MIQMQGDQQINRDVPRVVGERGFFYPRWWVLSALVLSLLFVIVLCFGRFFPCSAVGDLCRFTGWHPVFQVAALWLAFLLVAGLAFLLGLGSIEMPTPQRSGVAGFFRTISQFGPLRLLLEFYGAIALTVLCAMWLLDRAMPLAFAYLGMVVFVGNACFFYQRPAREQRRLLIVYGVAGLVSLPVTALYRLANPQIWPFFLAGALLLISGLAALFWHPRPERPLTAQEQLDASIARAATPGFLLRNLWPLNRFLPNRPERPF